MSAGNKTGGRHRGTRSEDTHRSQIKKKLRERKESLFCPKNETPEGSAAMRCARDRLIRKGLKDRKGNRVLPQRRKERIWLGKVARWLKLDTKIEN